LRQSEVKIEEKKDGNERVIRKRNMRWKKMTMAGT
jgi:hypothetical protein